jgi:flagellar hook protein FlgE
MRSHSEAIGVAGDNIANVNTMGFKRQRAIFTDVLGQSVAQAAGSPSAGAGSRIGHIERMFNQGALLTTDSPTDMAISGDGFFTVAGTVNGVSGSFYSRAGAFHIDTDGKLANPDGLLLQGYQADDSGAITSTIGDLTVSGAALKASPTASADLQVQLDSNSTVPPAWDPLSPDTTSNFSSSFSVFDSLGNSHEITTYFRKTGANSWEWHAMVDGDSIAGGIPGVPVEGASGTLTFTTDGALDIETPGASVWDFEGATPGQVISFDFGDAITSDGGSGLGATTQFAAENSTSGIFQDGFPAGSTAGLEVSSDGSVIGVFSNGQRRVLGRLSIAKFQSNHALARGGNTLYVETINSGPPLFGFAEAGGRGNIISGAVEQSNVDIGSEFVNLISYQRGFQANARVITTADEMYSELVNLKR